MTKCKHCGQAHSEKYHVANKLTDKGFPEHPKKAYEKAHRKANEAEKKRFPKGYEKLKKIDEKLPNHELIGKNLRNGKIEVSKKAPKSLQKEIAYHEKVENKLLRKKGR